MAFRFRRSVKILPGVRINFGKHGASVSVGGRGAHVTLGHGHVRRTVGIPGTGMSWTSTTRASPAGKATPTSSPFGASAPSPNTTGAAARGLLLGVVGAAISLGASALLVSCRQVNVLVALMAPAVLVFTWMRGARYFVVRATQAAAARRYTESSGFATVSAPGAKATTVRVVAWMALATIGCVVAVVTFRNRPATISTTEIPLPPVTAPTGSASKARTHRTRTAGAKISDPSTATPPGS